MNTSDKHSQLWNTFKIVFRLLSPLHIGYKKMRNIQYTRRYVPAKTLWGALTAATARTQNSREYNAIGGSLKRNLRFSYFYLSESRSGSNPLIPDYNKCLKFGGYSKVEFERKFLDSYASTALSPDYNSAKEESLHEIEILTHYIKDTASPIFLTGYIFEKQNTDNPYPWQDALKLLQIGGERKYGFGRTESIAPEQIKNTEKLFDMFKFTLNELNPKIIVTRAYPFPGHVVISQNKSIHGGQNKNDSEKITGETEILVFRETSEANKFGSDVSDPVVTYCPGCSSKFKVELEILENFILSSNKI
ncbi:MAG: hypothetical protein JXB88_11735 [Spirochaetales bacterium]|nr:hypothetical protein [Spirochaetales bacterium]